MYSFKGVNVDDDEIRDLPGIVLLYKSTFLLIS